MKLEVLQNYFVASKEKPTAKKLNPGVAQKCLLHSRLGKLIGTASCPAHAIQNPELKTYP